MNYDERDCRQAAAGQPPQGNYPSRPQYASPKVVIPVAPSTYQFWPNAGSRQQAPPAQHRYVPQIPQPQSVMQPLYQSYPVQSGMYQQQPPLQQHRPVVAIPPQQYTQHANVQVQPRQPTSLPLPSGSQQQFSGPQQRSAALQSHHSASQERPLFHQEPNPIPKQYSSSVQKPPKSQQASKPKQTNQPVVKPGIKPVDSIDLPVDYRLLLISMSDYYISQARSLASLIAHNQRDADVELYYKLMAIGMGCLEAVLNKYSSDMPPRQAAAVQLRYATLLYDETENDMEIESLLTKGISFCDMNRLFDLKYSMQHLLARVLNKSNVKASLKFLDNVIKDATTCQHVAWIYAFRFLRVSLVMQVLASHETLVALQDLSYMQDVARRRGDSAIVVIAAILEALIHLRSRDSDTVNEAQRAIAVARAEQLSGTTTSLPQLTALIHFADVACSLSPYEHAPVVKKMTVMQEYLDQIIEIKTWARDGSFTVPISRGTQQDLTNNTGGIFSKDANGRECLTFSWLARPDVYLIGFLLSGEAVYYRNPQDGRAEKFLTEGLKMTEDSYQIAEAPSNLPLNRACGRTRFRLILRCYLLLHQTLCHCERSAWSAMHNSLQALQKAVDTPGLHPPPDLRRFATYLKGVANHALGQLDDALAAYQHPSLTIPDNQKALTSPTYETLAVLATLNILFIILPSNHPLHETSQILLARLERFFPPTASTTTQSENNPHLCAAYQLYLALHSATLTSTKKHLKGALDLANRASASSLRAMILSYLASAFFAGQMGEEARQHVLGARHAARQAGSKLWTAAANGLVLGLLQREGKWDEARKVEHEGVTLVGGLGSGVRAMLQEQDVAGVGWVGTMGE